MKEKSKKVLVGMSGGVDSAVAALLLQKDGFEVRGLFIDFVGGEKSENDFKKARQVANKLGIEIYKVGAIKEFQEKIIDKFVADYEMGITPNPCVICNPEMKFKILIEEAKKRGIDFVATGHYVRLRRKAPISKSQFPNKSQNSNFKSQSLNQLFVAKDENKDQSYFLYRLTQEQLSKTIFPLGDYDKSEVRKIAEENGFDFKDEKESQDICFVADNDFGGFLKNKIKNNSGEIVDMNGRKLGEHNGLHFYTIGQRKGINLGGDGPYYVIRKDKLKNQLVVSNNSDDLFCQNGTFEIQDVNWIGDNLEFPLKAKVKTRYGNQGEYAIITKKDEDIFAVKLEKNQKAITSGQSAVFYSEGGEVLGGGIII